MSKAVSFKTWVAAARLRTLPLALATILLGTLLALFYGGFNWLVLILSIITAMNYQVLSNFANDLGDGLKGTDDNRQGEKRAIASGEISITQMKKAVTLFVVLSFVSGSLLSIIATSQLSLWITILFVTLGILAILAALYYTMGKRAYGYSGWGDVFVLIFFGWVGVIGSSYLQMNRVEPLLFLPATAVGFLAMGVLNLNNMRDIESDREAGKNTLVVKIGLTQAKYYHLLLLSGALVLHSIFVYKTKQTAFAFLYLLIIPLLVVNASKSWKAKKASDFEPLLKPLAIATLLFCLLAGIGQNL